MGTVDQEVLAWNLMQYSCASYGRATPSLSENMEKLSGMDKELIRDSWESLGKNKVPHGIVMFTR